MAQFNLVYSVNGVESSEVVTLEFNAPHFHVVNSTGDAGPTMYSPKWAMRAYLGEQRTYVSHTPV